MNWFDLAYFAALPVAAPAIAYKRARFGKYRESLPGMLGKRLPSAALPRPRVHRCWLHSVSVGETIAAASIYRELRGRGIPWEFLATTTTETGQAQAARVLEGVEHLSYAPADFSWIVRRFHDVYRPTLYFFFETEIWPNNLAEAGRRAVPTFMINGSISPRSASRYAKASFLFRPILSRVERFYMQTEEDAARMARILGSEARVEVTGNVKFSALPEPLSKQQRREMRSAWGADETSIVILAGSTHAPEEELIWEAFAEARKEHPEMRLVVAPRHPERFDEVGEMLGSKGAVVHRASGGPVRSSQKVDVVLLDQMGVLARSYGGCDIALVAGSWCPVGGHNLLEAAAHSIPVLRGPQMHEQPEIVRLLGPGDGAPEVPAAKLAAALSSLAGDPAERARLGSLARQAALSNAGAAGRVVDSILETLDQPPGPSR